RLWPNDIPGEPAFFERPNDVAGEVEFPPSQTMGGTTRLGVMIVMVAFAEGAEANPEIIFAVIGRFETAIPKGGHVADGIDGPGEIVNHEHRHVETPKQTHSAEGEIQKRGHAKMRQNIQIRPFPKPAVPNLAHIRRIPHGAIAKSGRLAHQ